MLATHPTQSMRSSCERCRLQKLKCESSSEGQATAEGPPSCQRCIRAKVPCVFGTRARGKGGRGRGRGRGRERTKSSEETIHESPIDVQDDIANGLATVLLPVDSPSTAGTWGAGQNYPSIDSMECDYSRDPEPVDEHILDTESEFFQTFLNTLHPTSQSAPPTPQNGGMDDMTASVCDATVTQVVEAQPFRGQSCCLGIDRLLSLTSEMHEYLRSLKIGSWRQEAGPHRTTPTSIDEYPIGAVLHICQKFVAISSSIVCRPNIGLPSDLGAVGGCPSVSLDSSGGTIRAEQSSSSTSLPNSLCLSNLSYTPAPPPFSTLTPIGVVCAGCGAGGRYIDTPAVLMILQCYISLTRIYGIVLDDFESHLNNNNIRNSDPHRDSNSPTTAQGLGTRQSLEHITMDRELRLRELRPANEDYSRTHAAVGMLLDALTKVENTIQLPSELRSMQDKTEHNTGDADNMWVIGLDLAVILLRQETASCPERPSQDGFSGLGKKIAGIKGLLRDKMGL